MPEILIEAHQLQTISLKEAGEYVIVLAGEGAEVVVTGTFESSATEKALVRVVIHHRAKHTRAETTLKGVARDSSSLTFAGRIIIDPECGDTSSFLTERILLLSEKAQAEAIPDLEILTDDVKCSHAASISSIPEEQLFYLQSRGLSRAAAETLIIEGFLGH